MLAFGARFPARQFRRHHLLRRRARPALVDGAAGGLLRRLAWCSAALYYPAAFAGGDVIAWTDSALVHFALFFAESVALLVPYCLLRPAMRPMTG